MTHSFPTRSLWQETPTTHSPTKPMSVGVTSLSEWRKRPSLTPTRCVELKTKTPFPTNSGEAANSVVVRKKPLTQWVSRGIEYHVTQGKVSGERNPTQWMERTFFARCEWVEKDTPTNSQTQLVALGNTPQQVAKWPQLMSRELEKDPHLVSRNKMPHCLLFSK